ncbi:BTB/POZ and TAZ domain-containing protein 1 [Dorcoceras hygrometricum]|uniref:BTB/POZ and TAZ domain-containing protein 1 n=1 Tax=Dorcoceras hygrometricum TaxID=472368 RepID=A0A2Z6ZS19_9LAMI|nr:BTB/POZ and TAZ domain-containing protein 1 [Dorcoceras hygrometricum]
MLRQRTVAARTAHYSCAHGALWLRARCTVAARSGRALPATVTDCRARCCVAPAAHLRALCAQVAATVCTSCARWRARRAALCRMLCRRRFAAVQRTRGGVATLF